MIGIGRLASADRDDWQTLFRGYNDFYERVLSPEMYDRAWNAFREDTRRHALGAKVEIRASASGRGKIVIYFQNHEEFERLHEQLTDAAHPSARRKAA